MELREIGLQNVRPRRHATTFEEAVNTMDGDFMRLYELMGIPIREVLAGRAWVRGSSDSSQLEVMIHQIELFLDQERENWTRDKHRYRRIEKQFARTLMVAIRTIRKKIVLEFAGETPRGPINLSETRCVLRVRTILRALDTKTEVQSETQNECDQILLRTL